MNGQILGDNTDGVGLVTDLKNNHGVNLEKKRLLILGAGGATRGILLPLLDANPQSICIANRTVEKALQLAEEFKQNIHACGFDALENHQFDIILNATSASLSDDLPPLPENILAENGICYDLAYSNQPTAFVRWGIEQNAHKSVDGLGMLVEQAAEAFFLWRGVRPSTQDVIDLLNAHR
jgi:shikimate dehydrogenase